MTFDRMALIASTLAFLAGVIPALTALRSGLWNRGSAQLLAMAIGFLFQTAAIYLRGQEVGQCPMKSVSDVLVFIAWSAVLLYFLVGSTFRLSLLGMFIAPLVTILQSLAFLLPGAFPAYPPRGPTNVYVELHAVLALVSYAAFALACITGIMYLLQARFLKRRQLGGLFYQLPPIQGLSKVIHRLVGLGLILLSGSLALSVKVGMPVRNQHAIFAWIVWALYAVIGIIIWRHALSPRQTAWLSVIGFVLPFISLWLVTHA